MSDHTRPQRARISPSRAIVRDILHFAHNIPLCAHERQVELASINRLRKACDARISLPVIFLKAYGIVAARRPLLRRWYLRWPIPHVFQHNANEAKLVMRREFEGDDWLFWARFLRPESSTLTELQGQLDQYQSAPVEEVFRQQVQFARLPVLARRALWWFTLNLTGRKRAKRVGTFALTTVAGQGTMIPQPPSLLTSTISYGPIADDGRATVSLTYDHRLMDGHHVADILRELDETLHTVIRAELRELSDD
ncbi:MAG: 2-oxo acid dehydrogenase subunit E2 [Pirellulales bacterium]|nr:2-oxo acid dehydrogenase subunit E2 [Pirellulales bacterium]